METARWKWHQGNGPIVGIALHAGHTIQSDLYPYLAISEEQRLREEDPYTDFWAKDCPSWVVVNRSRYEVDLNRSQNEAVYLTPEHSWGQKVWQKPLPTDLVARAHLEHLLFYQKLDIFLRQVVLNFGHFVVLDLHSYNHRRSGPDAPLADPALNPDLNVGTGSMDREYWRPIVDRFIHDMRVSCGADKSLDVRENVKFKGRYLAEYVHRHFPCKGCVLALEFKKNFMDEWTGAADVAALKAIADTLRFSVSGIEEVLNTHHERGAAHVG